MRCAAGQAKAVTGEAKGVTAQNCVAVLIASDFLQARLPVTLPRSFVCVLSAALHAATRSEAATPFCR